jgi:hypothetical protein
MPTNKKLNSGIVLPAHRVRVFDPRRVFEERIGNRKIVYLDTNVWIDLREAKNADALQCLESCLRSVEEGRAIFPVSFASISELHDNPSADARTKQADLMDSLCLGVALRNSSLVYAMEGEAVYRHIFSMEERSSIRHEAFTGVLDYLAGGSDKVGGYPNTPAETKPLALDSEINSHQHASLPEPSYHPDGYLSIPDGWRPADVEGLLVYLRNEKTVTIRWMVDHLNLDEIRDGHAAGVASYAERGSRKINHEENIQAERVSLYWEHVAPSIKKVISEMTPEQAASAAGVIHEAQGNRSPRQLRELFQIAAPSLETFACALAGQSVHPDRKSQRQDFWDIEHAGVASVYADAFVTADRKLISRLPVGDQRPPLARSIILGSVRELADWLDTKATTRSA